MALIDVDDVQPWLEPTKLRLDHDDPLTEEPFQSEFVKSRLASCDIDVTTWLDAATTPTLIKSIIGMLVAAQRYNTYYSETEDAGNAYANKLEERASMLLEGVCSGSIDLLDITDDPATTGFGSPLFYPDDSVGILVPEEGVRFTMGKKF
ncbi:MAG: hypothetical protein ACW99G_20225 [Candidatus Thorarchaeota archaeon]|jgi:hypothetical protein